MSLAIWLGAMLTAYGAGEVPLDAAIVERSLVDMGNTARLQHAMAKARRGEPVVFGVIGGSITAGARASTPEKCWGALAADWWRVAFPSSTVTFVNAGIGATCSDLAAHRVQRDLLSKNPNVVVIEFAVNDMINALTEETMEGLIRQILNAPQRPAVALFFTMDHAGKNRQAEHSCVGRHYGLPMVSMKDALWPEVEAGRMAWTDFEADEVHPNDTGHRYGAQLLGALFERVKEGLPEDAALPSAQPVPAPLISDLFEHTRLLNATSLDPARNEGWVRNGEDTQFGSGWKTETPGSLLEFKVEGRAISVLFWRIKGPMGIADAWVDDRKPVSLDAWFSADWGGYTPFQLVARDLGPGSHTLHVRLRDDANPASTGHAFQLRAVMTAGVIPVEEKATPQPPKE